MRRARAILWPVFASPNDPSNSDRAPTKTTVLHSCLAWNTLAKIAFQLMHEWNNKMRRKRHKVISGAISFDFPRALIFKSRVLSASERYFPFEIPLNPIRFHGYVEGKKTPSFSITVREGSVSHTRARCVTSLIFWHKPRNLILDILESFTYLHV